MILKTADHIFLKGESIQLSQFSPDTIQPTLCAADTRPGGRKGLPQFLHLGHQEIPVLIRGVVEGYDFHASPLKNFCQSDRVATVPSGHRDNPLYVTVYDRGIDSLYPCTDVVAKPG